MNFTKRSTLFKLLFLTIYISLPLIGQTMPAVEVIAEKLPTLADSLDTPESKTETLEDKVKDMTCFEGLFTFYQDTTNGELYMVITNDQLQKEYIHFLHAKDGVVDVGLNRGSYRQSKVFTLNKYFNRVEFVTQNTSFYFDKTNPLSRAADANISPAVMVSEKIIATDTTNTKYLINANNIFLSEDLYQIKTSFHGFSSKDRFSLGNLSSEKTKYQAINNYPKNSDIVVEYVYDNPSPSRGGSMGVTDARYVSLVLQHSLISMPDNNYQPRFDDPRVGYFTTWVQDMTSTDYTPWRDMIHRWNLEKKNPGAELSEPIKPIIWWIENTTPLEFRDAIKKGVLGWNKSFEKAGFKNAVQVKVQPDDAEWEAGDIRYNVLRWTSSPNPPFGGYGPSFVNPRTGEILGSDIMLEYVYFTNRVKYEGLYRSENDKHFCSAGEYLHQGNLFGTTALNMLTGEDASKKELVEESIIRLVLHELGHTFGLAHNFKSSHLHSPENIHNKSLTQKVGLTGSVMDYVSVNLSPNPEEQGEYYSTCTGPYDDWAIEYGYKPTESSEPEKEMLNNILSRSTEHELMFGHDADAMSWNGGGVDPRVMVDDMTSDPIRYAEDRMKLISGLYNQLKEKYSKKQTSYHPMKDAFFILDREYKNCVRVVSRYIGGVYVDRAFVGQVGADQPYRPVDIQTQKQAMSALECYLFSPDAFQDPAEVFPYLQRQRRGWDYSNEDPKLHDRVLSIQRSVLRHLLHPTVMKRITDTERYGNDYGLDQVLENLTSAIFEKDIARPVNSYRRNLQTEYTHQLIAVLHSNSYYNHLSKVQAYNQLNWVQNKVLKRKSRDKNTQAHREYLQHLITKALNEDFGK